jgi:pimeloyl-ACP methyl ester carboxylesterase
MKRMKGWIRIILKILALAITAAIVAGIIYEQVGQRQDRKRLPQIGQSVDIGGRTLNIFCSGEGSPTVILEGGYSWINVQPEIAKFTRVCCYDRAGFGRSDPGPYPRTSAAIASDLHEVLHAAAVPPPYVLVGASFGGFIVRVFAGTYPGEVAGMVLVDASHEDQHEPTSMKSTADRLPAPVRSTLCRLLPTMGRIGLVRLMLRSSSRVRDARRGLTQDQAVYLQFLSNQPKSFVASGNEACNWEESAAEARASRNLGDQPLIVLSAGQGFAPEDPTAAKEAAAFHEVWVHELQPQLARLSTRGRQVVVENGGHGIQYEAPEAVIGAVHEVVIQIRREQRK